MWKWTEDLTRYMRRVIASPIGELTRWQRTLRFSLDLGWHCAKALKYDRAGEMAAALTYRTIFSLVPLLVVILLVFQAFRGLEQVRRDLTPMLYQFAGLSTIQTAERPELMSDKAAAEDKAKLSEKDAAGKDMDGEQKDAGADENGVPDDHGDADADADADNGAADAAPVDDQPDAAAPPANADSDADGDSDAAAPANGAAVVGATDTGADTGDKAGGATKQAKGPGRANAGKDKDVVLNNNVDMQRKAAVDEWLNKVITQVADLNFQSIGAVGLVLFIWAALALAVTLEQSFNRVYNAPEGRPWHHRIPIYWAVMTLGPVLVWLSLSLAGRVVTWAADIPVIGAVVIALTNLAALAASWLLLFLLYKFMPNTNVKVKPALIGAFVAALLWEIAKWGFNLYVGKALPYSKIYGALGLIPLFLLWLYLTWVIVLFGLELTYTIQAMKGKRFKYNLPTWQDGDAGDPQWLLPIVATIARAFNRGATIDDHAVADTLRLPHRAVKRLTDELEKAGFVHRINGREENEARLSLARPAEQIKLRRVLELADKLRVGTDITRNDSAWTMLRDLAATQRRAVADLTVAALLREDKRIPIDSTTSEGEASQEAKSPPSPTGDAPTKDDGDDTPADDESDGSTEGQAVATSEPHSADEQTTSDEDADRPEREPIGEAR